MTKGNTMTLREEKELRLWENLKADSDQLIDASPVWLAEIRRQSWNKLMQAELPTTRHEEWKYFNLSAINFRQFNVSQSQDVRDEALLKDYLDADELTVVFINGVYSEKFSNINNKISQHIKLLPLQQALENHRELIEGFYKRTTVNDPEPFVSLNTSMHQDGVFLRVADQAIVDQTVHIFYVTTDSSSQVATFPRTMIYLGKSAQVSIVESYLGLTDSEYLINPLTDIHLSPNSVLNYYKVQTEGQSGIHIGAVRVWQEADSQLEAFSLSAGAIRARNNITVISDGEGADSIVDGLYVLNGSQILDNHTLIDHRKPNCTSHQLYKGILNDASHAIFNGKIYVQPIAQKTNSYQLNKHLLLGENSRVDTKPQLEISADDVKCTHGATIGQLNEDEVFYLRSRCIAKQDAIKMLSRGFVDDVLDRLRNQRVRQKLSRLLATKIAILSQA